MQVVYFITNCDDMFVDIAMFYLTGQVMPLEQAQHTFKKYVSLNLPILMTVIHFQVSDAGIVALVKGECGESLRELYIKNCIHITDFAVESIILHCTNLEVFILYGYPDSGN